MARDLRAESRAGMLLGANSRLPLDPADRLVASQTELTNCTMQTIQAARTGTTSWLFVIDDEDVRSCLTLASCELNFELQTLIVVSRHASRLLSVQSDLCVRLAQVNVVLFTLHTKRHTLCSVSSLHLLRDLRHLQQKPSLPGV